MKEEEFFVDVPDTSVEFLDKAKSLSAAERQEIADLARAINEKEAAEGPKESHKKMRVLYQRAPKNALPFIVYCVYVGIWGGVTLTRLPNYSGQKLWILSGLLALVMILPVFVLPLKRWTNGFHSIKNWLRSVRSG